MLISDWSSDLCSSDLVNYVRSPFSHVVESVCVRMRIPPIRLPVLIALAMAIPTRPVDASSLLDYVGQCVPFARAASGIQIYGDAWTWWGQAEDRYQRGHTPRIGSVIVFAKSPKLRLGHVAVISRIVDARVAMVTQDLKITRLNSSH